MLKDFEKKRVMLEIMDLYYENATVPGSVLAMILKPFCNSYLI